jgi:two-component system sensor histidine kinase KdpD
MIAKIPEKEKILVYIDSSPGSSELIKYAAKKAKEEDKSWEVLYVETPKHSNLYKESKRRVLNFIATAEKAGATTHQISHQNVAKSIIEFIESQEKNQIEISTIIVGNPVQKTLFEKFTKSTSQKIFQALQYKEVKIEIIPTYKTNASASVFERLQIKQLKPKSLSFAIFSFLASLLLVFLIQSAIPEITKESQNIIAMMVFLISSMLIATKSGLIPGLLSTILGFITINYFYILPESSLIIENKKDIINILAFAFSTTIASFIGAFRGGQNEIINSRKKRIQALYEIYRQASESMEVFGAIEILYPQLSNLISGNIAFFLSDKNNNLQLSYPKNINFNEEEKASLKETWKTLSPSGFGSIKNSHLNWRFEPMRTVRSNIGVIAFNFSQTNNIDPSFNLLIHTISEQVTSIIERIEMSKQMSLTIIQQEKEKFRSLLLSSISHDLKTPLSSIIASLHIHQNMQRNGKLDNETSKDLIKTASQEAQRLESFITNILEMTKIENNQIAIKSSWICPEEFLHKVKRDMQNVLSNCNYEIQIKSQDDEELEVKLDILTASQVIRNVIDNAIKYSKNIKKAEISYCQENDGILFSIKDFGQGIQEDKLEAIFNKYERLKNSDNTAAGTGLGLAICHAIMNAHQGFIKAKNHKDGGCIFEIWFPETRIEKH